MTAPDPQTVRESADAQAVAVAAQLRAARIDQGLTQGELADKSGLGVSVLCMWENGRAAPGLRNLTRWAGALGLEIAAVRPGEQAQTDPPHCSRCRRWDYDGHWTEGPDSAWLCGNCHTALAAGTDAGQEQDDRDDTLAMLDEGAPAGPARAVAEYWHTYALACSDSGRNATWTSVAHVAACILGAMNAEQAERDAEPKPCVCGDPNCMPYWRPVHEQMNAMRIRADRASADFTKALLEQVCELGTELDELRARREDAEGERVADVRAVARLITIASNHWYEGPDDQELIAAIADVHIRFNARMEALDARATDGGAR